MFWIFIVSIIIIIFLLLVVSNKKQTPEGVVKCKHDVSELRLLYWFSAVFK